MMALRTRGIPSLRGVSKLRLAVDGLVVSHYFNNHTDMLNNDRIWEAARVIATGCGDARSRVAVACNILDKISHRERATLPTHVQQKLEDLLREAGKSGPYINRYTRVVEIDQYTNTSRARYNRTYARLAEEIFQINEEINNQRPIF